MIVQVQLVHRTLYFFKGHLGRGIVNFCSQTLKNNNEKKEADKRELKISHNLVLHKVEKMGFAENSSKPLVLLFQWLYARQSAVNKYCDLYHDIGLDVLTVRGKISHFLWPPQGKKLSDELFEYLKSNCPPDQKFLVHAFSVGAYNYTITMHTALESQQETGHFRDKVIGQIFDSVVIGTYENMSHGIVEVLPPNKEFRKLVHHTLNLYYNITHKTTTATYDKLVDHFKKEPIRVPSLFIYSENDPMCNSAIVETMLAEWRFKWPEFDVTKVSWPESVHAAHLKKHREDYIAAWTGLMEKLKLI